MLTLYDVVKHNANGFGKLSANELKCAEAGRATKQRDKMGEKDMVNGFALILQMIKCVKKHLR